MNFKSFLLISVIGSTCMLCKGPSEPSRKNPTVEKSQPLIIYKTTQNYNQNTPVSLSPDGLVIQGYPSPSDLKSNNGLRIPAELKDGYLMDRRGIGPNSSFIELTYEEYSQLQEAPKMDQMYKMILEKHPIKEMWRCKRKANDELNIKYANELIETGQLEKLCERLK